MEYTDIELKNEQWRDIDGYDGAYQVSDLGRVRSKKYGDWRVLRPGKNNKGYLTIVLCKDGKRKLFSVHRLVAQAFIENDDESKTQINHIDECKQNNRLWNLEYCTSSYNLSYNGLRYRRPYTKYRRDKVKELYDPNLSYRQNLKIFRENGICCSIGTVHNLCRDLGLINTK